ncbi:porin family protein [Tenacibaculum sp. UWU-22]|uniref:type IX secretion/gliding motility protein PorT/SprT n=1 Tax=Tenacibaculum sp. UWU-22 TaxID=3234187 RepID=UPI0034DB3078
MTKFFLTISFLWLLTFSVFSQKHRTRIENRPNFDKLMFHYGFYLGLNRNDFKVDYRPNSITDNPNVIVEPKTGFNVGLIADLRLHKNINLRFEPGLVTNSKKLTFEYITGPDSEKIRDNVGSTFLHLPLILKFSTDRLDNVRPYVLGGVSFDHNFTSNEKNPDDNFSGSFRMQTSNFMYEIGIGIDIYLYYFKFSPSIRGIFAINNEIKYDDTSPSQWTDPINYLGTRGVFIHLAFE